MKIEEASTEECRTIARAFLKKAVQLAAKDEWDHAHAYLLEATIWIRGVYEKPNVKEVDLSEMQWENDGGFPPRVIQS